MSGNEHFGMFDSKHPPYDLEGDASKIEIEIANPKAGSQESSRGQRNTLRSDPLIKQPDEASMSDSNSSTELEKQLNALGLEDNAQSFDGNENNCSANGGHSQRESEVVWQNALSELALGMPPATFDTWMRDTQVLGYEDGEFIIGVPNAYACDWIKNRLRSQIKRTLSRLLSRSVQVTLRVSPPSVRDAEDGKPTPLYDTLASHSKDLPEGDGPSNHISPQDSPSAIAADAVDNQAIDRALSQSFQQEAPPSPVSPRPSLHSNNNVSSSALNASHTFDSFVVGNHNRLAHAAATAIAENPGTNFNPLFIYGGVGLGKTHLLHAVGNVANRNDHRVLYCTSEQFTNELILSIRNQSTEAFRNKYRQVDVLLIDDIQFIGGKESTQEEFFHTFNQLHAAGSQVVLSSDRPPKALATLEERLRSRFEGGLQTDISKPDFETRVAILQSKSFKTGMHIDQTVLMLIAERIDSNIRELEGALNRIVLHAKLFSNTLDMGLAESVLKTLAPQRTLRTPATVIRIVAEHFSLAEEDLKSKTRTKEIAHARQVAMYLLREENALSLPSIGEYLGGRDHSTVRHGVDKINNDIEKNDVVKHQIMALREQIYAAPGLDA
ncbi:MAG: chromosomal replication initiator protein DnaA [Chloroflexota bacterium]